MDTDGERDYLLQGKGFGTLLLSSIKETKNLLQMQPNGFGRAFPKDSEGPLYRAVPLWV